MKNILNEYFKVIYVDKANEALILKNQVDNAMVRLSQVEYDIVAKYSETPDYEAVQNAYKDQFEMDSNFVEQLVEHARNLKLLIDDKEQEELDADYAKSQNKNATLDYFFTRISAILQSLLGLTIKSELKGNFRFYKVFSMDLANTWLEKVCLNKAFQVIMLLSYFIALVAGTVLLFSFDSYTVEYMKIAGATTISPFTVVLILLVTVAFTYFLHESAHYFVYKMYGGHSNNMGFAFLQVLIPVFYTSVDSMYFWKEKGRKIKVTAAGIAVDVLITLYLFNILFWLGTSYPNVSFVCLALVYFMVIRTFINCNFFVPGTDGYFIIVDAFDMENYYQNASDEVVDSFKALSKFQVGKFLNSVSTHWGKYLYIFTSAVFITIYWLMLFAAIFLPILFQFLI